MLNKIVIIGRLTDEPELRHTANATPVASFTIAVERDFKGNDGQKQTDFINCVAWRGTAEFVSKYFSKGSMAVVSGRLQIRSYQDRDGNNRTVAEVLADNIYFGESRRSSDSNDSHNSRDSRDASASEQESGFVELGDEDGDLPF